MKTMILALMMLCPSIGYAGTHMMQGDAAGGSLTGTYPNPTIAAHVTTSGSAPIISACGATPNGSVVGNDNTGKITIGGGVVTSCTMTFATTWTNAPSCTVLGNATTFTPAGTTSTTVLTLSASATFGGDVLMYNCFGY